MTDKSYYATGKRKSSIARVWIKEGSGAILVNRKSIDEYFTRESLKRMDRPASGHHRKEGEVRFIRQCPGRRHVGPGGSRKAGNFQGPRRIRSRFEIDSQKSGIPDQGFENQGKKEVRSARGKKEIPVLKTISTHVLKGGYGLLFCVWRRIC